MSEHEQVDPVLHKVNYFQHPADLSVHCGCKAGGFETFFTSENPFGHINIAIGDTESKIEPQGEDGNLEIGPEWLLEEGFGGHPEGEVVLGTVQQVGVEEYVLGSSLDGDFVQQIYH